MELAGVRPGRRSRAEIERRVAALVDAAPTYDHVGSTLVRAPSDVSVLHVERVVPGDVAAAAAALARWAAHDGIGARVVPDRAPVVGATVAIAVPAGPLELLVVDRVVAVIDEPERAGFAYGTLPGHPERGEELFLATTAGAGFVRLQVVAHSRPAGIAALVPPVVRLLQRTAARRYLDAWASALRPGR
jgi:uncharacterized protein (UPF0548 family)